MEEANQGRNHARIHKNVWKHVEKYSDIKYWIVSVDLFPHQMPKSQSGRNVSPAHSHGQWCNKCTKEEKTSDPRTFDSSTAANPSFPFAQWILRKNFFLFPFTPFVSTTSSTQCPLCFTWLEECAKGKSHLAFFPSSSPFLQLLLSPQVDSTFRYSLHLLLSLLLKTLRKGSNGGDVENGCGSCKMQMRRERGKKYRKESKVRDTRGYNTTSHQLSLFLTARIFTFILCSLNVSFWSIERVSLSWLSWYILRKNPNFDPSNLISFIHSKSVYLFSFTTQTPSENSSHCHDTNDDSKCVHLFLWLHVFCISLILVFFLFKL